MIATPLDAAGGTTIRSNPQTRWGLCKKGSPPQCSPRKVAAMLPHLVLPYLTTVLFIDTGPQESNMY